MAGGDIWICVRTVGKFVRLFVMFIVIFVISFILGLISERALRSWQRWLRRRYAREAVLEQYPRSLPQSSRVTSFNRRTLTMEDVQRLREQRMEVVASWCFEHKREWFWNKLKELQVPYQRGVVNVRIVRSGNVLEQSFAQVMKLSPEDMHKTFRVNFDGEAGLDAGGLLKEWLQLVCEQIFDLNNALFHFSEIDNLTYQINPLSCVHEQYLDYYYFLGKVLGKAIFEHVPVSAHLTKTLYKHVLGAPIELSDLEAIDQSTFKSLEYVLENDVDDLCLGSFTVTNDAFGTKDIVELKPGGADIEVTNENKKEYVELYVNWITTERIKEHIEQFKVGLFEVLPRALLSIFTWQELQLLMCGLPEIDVAEWKSHTIYSGELSASHRVVKWFWEIVEVFSQEQRAKLLQFVTGTSRVPVQGFAGLEGSGGSLRPFHITSIDLNISAYPRAHTCFNRLDLPLYSSKEVLEERLTLAVEVESVGFGLE